MAQRTSGVRALLSSPRIYDGVQNLLGARRARAVVVREHLRLPAGALLLDVGCGTGEIVAQLPHDVRYVGFDLSKAYIDAARARFGDRGRFEQRDVADAAAVDVDRPDVALAFGLLHHLDDGEVAQLLGVLRERVRRGGRVVTIDPTIVAGQHPMAASLARRDRGQNVRGPEAYAALASGFAQVTPIVRHDLLRVPYSHCILELTTSSEGA